MNRTRRLAVALLVGTLAAALAACGSSGQQGPPPRTLTVFAAASLNDVYTQLKGQFEQQNPGVTVRISPGGSDTLAQQVVQGQAADVLATASTTTMRTAQQAGRIQGQPVTYATNKLQIATAPNNPKNVRSLQDLARPDVLSVVCLPTVPCGAAATAAEKAAGVTLMPRSQEQDVTLVLNRVETGNADAGLVYVTDVKSAAGKVAGVDFPQATAQGAAQTYPIGAVVGSPNTDLAQKWIQLVTGPQGKAALGQAGFGLTG